MRFLLLALVFFTMPAFAAQKTAVFAGGCFWCMESEYQGLDGVSAVVSGFTGGTKDTATYDQVSRGNTGHREAVEITYDPEKVTYAKLLEIFWNNVDPFDDEGQFCDKGEQYTAAIYVHDEAERKLAQQSLEKIEKRHDKQVATIIADAAPFYAAEEYHQDYFEKNAVRYKLYRNGCGRDARMDALKR